MRIVYLDLDALNPSHLSCYGYLRNTSPNLDALAARGLRATNVYCSDAPCLPSRTAFYAGRFGIQTGVVGHGGTAADPKPQGTSRGFKDAFTEEGLAGQLSHRGYHTAMISPFGDRHSAHHFYAGFNEIHNTGKSGMEIVSEVEPVLERWLDHHASDENWYLHLNFWDIHTPYRTPDGFGDPFKDDPLPDWYTEQLVSRQLKKTGPHSPLDLGMYDTTDLWTKWGFVRGDIQRYPSTISSLDDLRLWINGYDAAIKYVDDAIGRMIRKLETAGILDDTLILVSADHGENQGDLGIYGEHGTADHGTCHLPFIIAGPGVVQGAVDHELHYHLDFAPSLIDLLDGTDAKCPEIWDGKSWADTLRTGKPAGREDLIVSQCCHVAQRGVRFSTDTNHAWMYVRTYHDGFHNFPQEMLFNLVDDPHELSDVAADHPEVCAEAAWRLSRWHDANMQKMAHYCSNVTDPLWTVIQEGGPFHASVAPGKPSPTPQGVRDYVQRLEDTGRSDGAARLRANHARRFAKFNPTDAPL